MSALRRPESWVFLILFGSYAFFWHSRDWNSASRLMLTYAIVDRGTVSIDGLDGQTGDKAADKGHFYCDKLPGYSLLECLPYLAIKYAFGVPDHPLNRKAFAYWPADYGMILATSGLLSALTGVLLTQVARRLGCGPRCALLVGMAYGLATPAYVYATLGYGHQATAFALLAAFVLLWRRESRWQTLKVFLAGFLAAYASVIELQVGPVSAILGFFLLAQVSVRQRSPAAIGVFALGAALPTLCLLGYNQLAFGSPWEMGYFHHATSMFRKVHSTQNPLGLRWPDVTKVRPLLWGSYRGLLFYAPIVILAAPGWLVLARRRNWAAAVVSAAVVLAVFLVNLSYPEWTGGWCTGPRLLVPLLPFAMIPVAALLATGSRWVTGAASVLALGGGILMLLFQGVGGRIPQFIGPSALVYESTDRGAGLDPRHKLAEMPPDLDPLRDAVLPLWTGAPTPPWVYDGRFAWNLVRLAMPGPIARLPESLQWIQFLPLVLAQMLTLAMAYQAVREPGTGSGNASTSAETIARSDLGIDHQQHGRRDDENTHDVRRKPKGVGPDPPPGLVT